MKKGLVWLKSPISLSRPRNISIYVWKNVNMTSTCMHGAGFVWVYVGESWTWSACSTCNWRCTPAAASSLDAHFLCKFHTCMSGLCFCVILIHACCIHSHICSGSKAQLKRWTFQFAHKQRMRFRSCRTFWWFLAESWMEQLKCRTFMSVQSTI